MHLLYHIILDEYVNVKNSVCSNLQIQTSFDTFIGAKEYCSSEPNCFGIQYTILGNYYICIYPLQMESQSGSFDIFKRMRSSGD